jgi:lysophospholipid acyltransferase (LPLAT)-like uncharacterized protein
LTDQKFRRYFLPRLLWTIYRSLSSTWRIECVEPEALVEARSDGRLLIFAHWHRDELCILPHIATYKIASMVSMSYDGDVMAYAFRKLKGACSRGSSTRRGVSAAKGLIALMKQGYRASLAVDGPKGPRHKVKPGVFGVSRLAGASIVPVGVACSRAFIFERSWNKAKLPKPFSRISIVFGEPWAVIPRDEDADEAAWAKRLEKELTAACERSNRRVGANS